MRGAVSCANGMFITLVHSDEFPLLVHLCRFAYLRWPVAMAVLLRKWAELELVPVIANISI